MLCMWNNKTDQYYTSIWIIFIDESMLFWSNNYTIPGFMFLPHKPWPFGNDYHNICCGFSCILFGIYLFEGKDWPKELEKLVYNDNGGDTCVLLMMLIRKIWRSGKALVMDSGC